MKRHLFVVGVLLFLFFISCDIGFKPNYTENINGIQKSVIKYAINPDASPLNSYSSLYFIQFGEYSGSGMLTGIIDPSDELSSQLQSEFYNVRPASKGENIFDATHNGYYDKISGEQGVLITVGNQIYEKVNDTTIKILVEIFLGDLFAEGYVYTLQFDGNNWVKIAIDPTWIS